MCGSVPAAVDEQDGWFFGGGFDGACHVDPVSLSLVGGVGGLCVFLVLFRSSLRGFACTRKDLAKGG